MVIHEQEQKDVGEYQAAGLLQNIRESLERGEHISTFDYLRQLASFDQNILAFTCEPYAYVWEPDDGVTPDIQKTLRNVQKPRFFLTREQILQPETQITDAAEVIRTQTGDSYWNIAIRSDVDYMDKNEGLQKRYLGLMDMILPADNPANLTLLKQRLEEVVVPAYGGGVVINSGNSFHFLSARTFSRDEMLRFYGACLKLEIPVYRSSTGTAVHIPDGRYIGNSLEFRDGVGGLRLTQSPNKPTLPHVVAVVG